MKTLLGTMLNGIKFWTNSLVQGTKKELQENIKTVQASVNQVQRIANNAEAIANNAQHVAMTSQSNWDQNDETKNDYIKNRPFYEYTNFVSELSLTATKISETTLSLDISWQQLYDITFLTYSNGFVRYADIIKNLKIYFSDYNGYISLYIGEDSFSFPPYSTQNLILTGQNFMEETYLVEFGSEVQSYKTIEEKFLPSSVEKAIENAQTALDSSTEAKQLAMQAQTSANNKISYQDFKIQTNYNFSNAKLKNIGNRFYGVLQDSKVISSEDGIIWIEEKFPFEANWKSIGYGENTILITSDSEIAIYSRDNGLSWTGMYLPSAKNWDNIVYGNNKFIVFPTNSNKGVYCQLNKIYQWTEINLPFENTGSMIYGDSGFLAFDYKNGYHTQAAYSINGFSWNPATLPSFLVNGPGLYYNNKYYLKDDGQIYYTTDFSNWNLVYDGQSLMGFACSNNKIMSIEYNFKQIVYSEDGINWSKAQLNHDWSSLCCGNNKYIATSGERIAYSYDGINWIETAKSLVQNDQNIIQQVKEILQIPENKALEIIITQNEDGSLSSSHTYEQIFRAYKDNVEIKLYVKNIYVDGGPGLMTGELHNVYFDFYDFMDEFYFQKILFNGYLLVGYTIAISPIGDPVRIYYKSKNISEGLKRKIVETLPEISEAENNTIYMVPKATSLLSNVYDEFINIDGVWEKIGDTSVNLEDYTTKDFLQENYQPKGEYITKEEFSESSGGISVTGATVGQTVKIAAVDENGVPTAWESVDFPSGGSGGEKPLELIIDTTVPENCERVIFREDINGNAFELSDFIFDFRGANYISGDPSLSLFLRSDSMYHGDTDAQHRYYGPPVNLSVRTDHNVMAEVMHLGNGTYITKTSDGAKNYGAVKVGIDNNRSVGLKEIAVIVSNAGSGETYRIHAGSRIRVWGRRV